MSLAFDTISDNLIVVDTASGIFELNLKTGEKKQFVSEKTVIGISVRKLSTLVSIVSLTIPLQDARPAKFFNSIAVAKNGDFYFTDSSSDFSIDRVLLSFITNPSGRLIHMSRTTGKITVLLDKLWFANGIALSPEEDFLVVSDLQRSKIIKVWLKPGKFGESETFAEGLPGTPDNLTPDQNGFYAAIPITADPQHPYIIGSMANMPIIRKFFARILALIDLLFTNLDKIYPNDFFKTLAYKSGSFDLVHPFLSTRSTVLRFDWNGKIIAAYHASDGGVYTHAMELDGHLYLGSFTQNYIAKVVKRAHL